ncbi:MAG: S8 family peptidase [Bacteroidales bacterium]|nr:S8 family peptidase [Bacteroidales bacterium]
MSAVVCVGAVDYNDTPANFSSEGPVTWQESSYKDYPYSVEINLEEGWLYYDNNLIVEAIGGPETFYWGVRFPASIMSQYKGQYLTKVSMFDDVENSGNIMIYIGGESSPGTLVHTQAYSGTGSRKFVEYTLTESIAVDASQPIWIVMSTEKGNTYPAPVCKNSGDKDSRWISMDGTMWNDMVDYELNYSWMIRAFVSNSTDKNISELKPLVMEYKVGEGMLSSRISNTVDNSFGLIRPDVSAPGVNIVSLAYNDNEGFSTMSGTSMATPCAAGVMALLLDKNPDITPSDICRLLETTSIALSSSKSNRTGSGRIDALEAINATPYFFIGTAGTDWNAAENWNAAGIPSDENANISIKAPAAINETLEYNSITIENEGSLTLNTNAVLSLTESLCNSNAASLIINDGAQLLQNSENVKATFNMNIVNPTTWSNHKDGWQFVSSPFNDAELSQFTTGNYDLYKYDGTAELEWLNYKQTDNVVFNTGIFDLGVGYLLAHQDIQILSLNGTLNNNNTETWNLTYNTDKELANFHLIGNPFTFDMDWSKMNKNNVVDGFAVLNTDDDENSGGAYVYKTSGVIKVGDSFFVKTKGNNPFISYGTSKEHGDNDEKVKSVSLIATGKSGSDNLIIKLSSAENEGFNKLENFNDEIATVFIIQNDKRYGIANYDKDVESVDVSFVAKEMGSYSIAAQTDGDFKVLNLLDRFTGIETNLLLEDYHFTATSNDEHNRFILKFAHDTQHETQNNFVYQNGDELILQIEGSVQIIDMIGRVVYSCDITNGNNRINISALNNAAYLVKIVTDEDIKIQKFTKR